MFGVGSGYKRLEFEGFRFGQGSSAVPGKLRFPIDADPGNQRGGLVFAEAIDIAIEGGIERRFTGKHIQISISGNDDENRVGVFYIVFKRGENIHVVGQDAVQRWIESVPIFFQVDQQGEFRAVEKNVPMIFLHACTERIQIKSLQSFFGIGLAGFVGHEQFSIPEKNIGFHAAKSLVKGIKQRPGMGVIIMGVGLSEQERLRFGGECHETIQKNRC